MLKGIDLTALAQRIQANASLKRDYIVASNKAEMAVDTDGKTSLIVPDFGAHPLLPIAHRQLGSYLKIPADYYDRMATTAPKLLADNVNTWFSRSAPEAKRMVRTLGGDTRALLSNSYQRIEHEEIANVVFPVLAELRGVQIMSCEVTDKRLYIHFVLPTVQGEVKRGDVVQAGGIIQNSEIGFGAVTVSGLIWRLVCLNGLKTTEAFRRNHVGRRVDEAGELDAIWADDTKKADDSTVLLKVRDMVRAVVDETRFRANLDKMRALTDATISPGSMTKAVEVLTQKVGLPDTSRPGILESLAAGADLSAWGLINAVTHQAHTAATYDQAFELEGIGGQLLDMAPSEWKRILEAA